MSDFLIHGVPGSPYVRAPLLALEEKGAPWRLAPIAMGGNRTPEYRSIHPFAKVPTLDHGDFRLYETRAILNYIDRLLPSPSLTPSDIREAARMDQVIGIIDAYVMPRISGAVTFPVLIAPRFGMPVDPDAVAAAPAPAGEVIDELARLLGDQPFIAGSSLSLADLMLIPHLAFLPGFDEGAAMLAGHDRLRAWIDRTKARPSFAATEWEVLSALAA
ncbi:MAG: putative glutathione S-transferase [Sphingomonas bacterium]|nr:putative glutathione S-transferase [Sphingomonas bacterium]